MFDVFATYLQSKANFTAEDLERVRAASVLRPLRKRQYLLQAGDVLLAHSFVTAGCLRTYSVDPKGAEHTMYFSVENWWAGDQESLTTGLPSRFNIEAIEDSVVVQIKKEDFAQLRREVPPLDKVVNDILYRSFVAAQGRIHSAISYSAEEKYREFLQKYPGLALRVPQHMIASFLGITTETLSRIRRHLH
ncbi:Crp/Fnr family transcriptional regulator [Hymenobacter cellulosilyticus]|uniref:Crp/Fnr family transcriptional regulator n=1 Tax=Hymenobacter cellulosilyticus TaxID=2932248 RepID=A0A8T9Q329_9BACT|nr:Crp/Fnr family transcriptional regulator [Hymenobacter cellulosilyticus]UOQ72136.1 Crp/Fnr family transcriptional regulator [Hymenobacter cellulosilyticus]